MLAEYKTIMDDLLDYTVKGIHEGLTAPGFNGISFDSTAITNMKYQFIKKYESVDSITDKNIIPVLVISHPEQYLKGKILYKGQFIDLKSILIKDQTATSTGPFIKKINFYIVPQLLGITGHNLGSLQYDLKVDYVTDYDIYGFISKEINSILEHHYFKPNCGEFFNLTSPTKGNLFFVPTQGRFINQDSILNRIAQSFDIKFCSIV